MFYILCMRSDKHSVMENVFSKVCTPIDSQLSNQIIEIFEKFLTADKNFRQLEFLRAAVSQPEVLQYPYQQAHWTFHFAEERDSNGIKLYNNVLIMPYGSHEERVKE